MKLNVYCPIWGMVPDYVERIATPIAPVLEKIKTAGYEGVEMTVPLAAEQKRELKKLLSALDLKLIALQWAASGSSLQSYLKVYEQHILSAAELEPIFINCHSGKDYYSYSDNCNVIDKAFAIEESIGRPIIHETHRSRFTFHACHIQRYLTRYPKLRLAADFSHWCAVSETLLEDQENHVNNAIKHAVHVHARVGFQQGCQVSDPRAPEFEEALNRHFGWWDKIYQHRKSRGEREITFTPEFGPYPYMPSKPFSKEALANQWEVNLWMKDQLTKRYQSK